MKGRWCLTPAFPPAWVGLLELTSLTMRGSPQSCDKGVMVSDTAFVGRRVAEERRVSGGNRGPGTGGSYGRRKGVDVVGAVVAAAVDEEGRCPGDTAQVGAVDVFGDAGSADVALHAVGEAFDVEPELLGVGGEVVRSRRGRSAVARNSSQVIVAAPSAALRIPTFASSSCLPSNASVATRSETVKPIPAIVPPPATAAQPTGGCSRPRLSRVASHVHPRMPTGLPTT